MDLMLKLIDLNELFCVGLTKHDLCDLCDNFLDGEDVYEDDQLVQIMKSYNRLDQ